ncbi:hypothetical protein [Azoarcus taiwanensis]|uniref:Conjugal transfer protein TrbJ n=1 Tax=Azoarcus taiwanensis TaxID=666964 RepID=A0A972FKT3_9RHOO|nr:hypothetical protein [Azoarcus taiwanensis]NMG04111.1 hypothetical protein [Azoarcus taiwanensis]
MTKTLAAALAAASILTAPAPAIAGGGMSGGATEVTQILNNIQLMLQVVKQEMEYALQMEQYMVELQQLMPGEMIAFGEFMLDAQQTISSARQVYNAGSRLYGSLEDLQAISENRFKQFASSGLTWEDYLAREGQIVQHQRDRVGILTLHEAHVAKAVQRNHENFARFAQEIPRTQGSHEALQVLNGQVAMLNGTLNEALHFQLAQSHRATARDVDQAIARDLERQAVERFIADQRAADEKARGMLDEFFTRPEAR